jgi:effector-binding domain-containing protein
MGKFEITINEIEPKIALSIRDTTTAAELGKKFGELYGEIGQFMKQKGLKQSFHLFGIYHGFTPQDVDLEAAVPFTGSTEPEGRIRIMKTYGGKAVCLKYYGPYDKLADGWNEMQSYVKENNLEASAPCFELYVTDPGSEEDSAKWLTEIYFPVK